MTIDFSFPSETDESRAETGSTRRATGDLPI